MRRILESLLAVVLSCLLAVPSQAAFNAGTQWDIQTTGLDTNGGAFDPTVASPGTDESLGAGTAITITLTGTTTGTGSPVFSATTHGPGNFVNIASGAGCTTGWFEIISQSAGTATFDHAMGVSTNVCVGRIGGPLLTFSQAYTNQVAVAGNTINVKSGTYTISAALTLSAGSPTYVGYGTTHGDGGTKPLLTTATNSIDLVKVGGAHANFTNISFSSTAGTRGIGFDATGAAAYLNLLNSKLSGFSVGIFGEFTANYNFVTLGVVNTEITGSTSHAIQNNSYTYLNGAYIHGNTGDGWNGGVSGSNSAVGNFTCINSLITANAYGARDTRATLYLPSIYGCDISNNTNDGVSFTGATPQTSPNIANSIFYGNGGWGVNLTSTTIPPGANQNNGYGSNMSGARNNLAVGTGDVTLSANPFTNSGSGDYSLNNTAGGGAALKTFGFPAVFPGGTTTGAMSIGAVQPAGTSATVHGSGFVQ